MFSHYFSAFAATTKPHLRISENNECKGVLKGSKMNDVSPETSPSDVWTLEKNSGLHTT